MRLLKPSDPPVLEVSVDLPSESTSALLIANSSSLESELLPWKLTPNLEPKSITSLLSAGFALRLEDLQTTQTIYNNEHVSEFIL